MDDLRLRTRGPGLHHHALIEPLNCLSDGQYIKCNNFRIEKNKNYLNSRVVSRLILLLFRFIKMFYKDFR